MKNRSQRLFFAARFAYCGRDFCGVQEQPDQKTVLGALRERLSRASSTPIMGLAISARTDRGVHALMNLATFWVRKPLCEKTFLMRTREPSKDGLFGVRVQSIPQDVHARKTLGKIYRYMICDGSTSSSPYSWHIVPTLDLQAMNRAAKLITGIHDFSSFRGGGCVSASPIKNLVSVRVKRLANSTVSIDFQGDAFLRRMIRNLVGLLVEVGTGLRDAEEVPGILAAKKRTAAGICAPACGLTLVKVLHSHLGE